MFHEPLRVVWSPLRRYRRCWSAGWSGSRRADGYLPGTLWLLAGVVLAGAVQDFMVLFISSRRNGASLGEMIKEEMGPVPGTIALFGCFLIMIIILAVLALIVVKALAESPVGCFHRSLNRTDCAVYGYLHALYPSGACG